MVHIKKMNATAWDADALDALRPSVARSPFGPLAAAEEMLVGALLFEYVDGGSRALVAVRPVSFAAGRRLDVVGLASTGDRLNAARFAHALDGLALVEFDTRLLCMTTQVQHVAKACMRQGWTVSGAVLLKVLEPMQ